MGRPVKILILDGQAEEAELMVFQLRRAGFEPNWKMVDNERDFLKEVSQQPDAIIGNGSRTNFTSEQALKLLREQRLDIPFILVDALKTGESATIAAVGEGASEHLSKDELGRLGTVLARVLEHSHAWRERRRADEGIRRTEELYRRAISSADAVPYLFDFKTGSYTFMGEGIWQLTGYTVREINRELWRRIIKDSVMQGTLVGLSKEEASRKSMKGEVLNWRCDMLVETRSGELRWISDTSVHNLDEEGFPVGSVGILQDITDRKRAEISTAALSKLGQSLSSAKTPVEAARIIASVSGELFGWDAFTLDSYSPLEDLIFSILAVDTIGGIRMDLPLASERGKPSVRARRALEQGPQLILREPGSAPDVEAVPFGDKQRASAAIMLVPVRSSNRPIGILSLQSYTARAYTQSDLKTFQNFADYCGGALERIEAEQAFRKSESQFRLVWNSSSEGMRLTDKDGIILMVNDAFCRMMHKAKSELEGRPFTVIHGEEQTEKVLLEARERIETGAIQPRLEREVILWNGRKVWFESSNTLLELPGQPAMLLSVFRDITERKQAERQMQEQARLLDMAHDAILMKDAEEQIIYWNRGAEQLYGWTAEETLGRKITELLYRETAAFEEAKKSLLVEGDWSGELRQVTKSGEEVVVHSRGTLMRDAEGNPKSVLVINADITEKKKLEVQLLRAQRMESIGTLASGIAHDLNNILAPITIAAQILKMKPLDDETGHLVNRIESSAQRGADVVRQVLTFARGIEGERALLQPRHLVNEVIKIIKETFPKTITLSYRLADDLWPVTGDVTQLHQVLLNLCVNARDAMPSGGNLSLKAENILLDEAAVLLHGAKVGPYIVMEVKDTGPGIPPEIMEKIFEPFFTTKEVGKGTGLGLSTAMGIVKSHGGHLNVYSEAEKGAAFKIYIPATPNAEMLRANKQEAAFPLGRGELILVVDDETDIREVTRKILVKHGYLVLTAADGAEAMAIFVGQKSGDINLVLTDIMMPRMEGIALIKSLKRIDPKVKIIASSGLTHGPGQTDRSEELAGLGVKTFLAKPYTAEKLLAAIDGLLV
jgi:two-component system, cell cycle sensor histidine kinase and response regulator CckA